MKTLRKAYDKFRIYIKGNEEQLNHYELSWEKAAENFYKICETLYEEDNKKLGGNMKITIYELFGLMLKRQAPKKIEVLGFTMNYVKNAHWGDYEDEETHIRLSSFRLNECLNDEVEILEEDKKIPEKLGYFDLTKDKNEKDENGNNLELHYTGVADTFDDVYDKINEIIDYLDYLKSKGDE